MDVFFNGASFAQQATSLHHAGELLKRMMLAVEALVEIGADEQRMYRDEQVQDRLLTPEHSFKAAFDFRYKQIVAEQQAQAVAGATGVRTRLAPERDRFRRLLARLTQSPFAADVFDAPGYVVDYEDIDVTYAALGYAAHRTKAVFEGTGSTAVVVSLDECSAYNAAWLAVSYLVDGSDAIEQRAVWNVRTPDCVGRERRLYQKNSKHDVPSHWAGVEISPMHLDDRGAQRVLDRAVKLPNEPRLFARHEGRMYVFPCHLHNEHGQWYHGFSVRPASLRQADSPIYNQLQKLLGWPELAI